MEVPLILRRDHVSAFDGPAQRSRPPSVAIVYTTADGCAEMLEGGRPLSWGEQLRNRRFRHRYEVDVSDHHHRYHLRRSAPPAQGGIYRFPAEVNVGFRVVDPIEVVRRNIENGIAVVAGYVTPLLHGVTAKFGVDEVREAEDAVNQRFRLPATVGGCIELYGCRVRLDPDPEAAGLLRREQAARLENRARTAEHQREAEEARRQNLLALIEQSGRLEQTDREREALAGRPRSLQDLIAMHLENNPGDIEGAIRMTAEVQAQQHQYDVDSENRDWERAKYLADKNLMRPDEVISVGRRFRSDGEERASQLTADGDGWDDELPKPNGKGPLGSTG
ncbi:hypothetical protein BJ973_004078 [Actinoplanes tereljensis]|uniref:PE-PGRS family protein n=1 Tax=Paractinoplanes tereljensis TaxID=571912 RepID=A0A919TX25_9ACTN|nr:hypothetical protein [Actinoplanes tereljensis]GIF23467.1 hypothetical protein Ate02nite_61970 [Actinoplanes tereljensis]